MSQGCKTEIASVPLLTDCPGQNETMLFMGATGGRGSQKYAQRTWTKILACLGLAVPPDDLYFVVPTSGSPYVNDGGNIITLPADFDRWRVRVVRNNVPYDYGEQVAGDPYWTRDLDTNTIALSVDALQGDKFMIWAYKYVSA